MTATVKKGQKKGSKKKAPFPSLPPSADVVTISGREYIIAPFDEFKEWEEDKALAALVAERLEDGTPHLSLEEFEKRIGQKKKSRKK